MPNLFPSHQKLQNALSNVVPRKQVSSISDVLTGSFCEHSPSLTRQQPFPLQLALEGGVLAPFSDKNLLLSSWLAFAWHHCQLAWTPLGEAAPRPPEMVFAAYGTKMSTQGCPGREAAYTWKRERNGPWRRCSSGLFWSLSPPPFCARPARLKSQFPRLSMALAPRLARQACLWVTAHWRTHRAHPHCRGSCSTSEVGCRLRLPHSASSSKTHREVSVVWLACRFTDILYHKTCTFWCNWNVGWFCNRMSRCRNRWILLTMGHWQCSTTAAPQVSAHLKRNSLAKPCRIFATLGFVLHTGTFCHSTLKNKTRTVNILNTGSLH